MLWVNTMSGDKLDPAGVKAKFGVPPDRIIDYLALMGDAVDNVPGVDKVGPKTACKLIEQYGSLEGVIAHADEVKGVVGENLRSVKDWLPTGRAAPHREDRRGAALRDGVARWTRAPTTRSSAELFGRFGFRTLRDSLLNKEDAPEKGDCLPRGGPAHRTEEQRAAGARSMEKKGRNFAILNAGIDQVADITPFVDTRNYETVLDEEALERWAKQLEAAPIACIDTETTSLDPMLAELVGISIRATPGEGAYIPLTHRYAGAPAQLPVDQRARAPQALARGRERRLKVGQNTKYDRQVFGNYGIATRGFAHDTLLQSYVLQSHQRHDMDALATRFLGASGLLQYADVAGKGASSIPFDQVDIERATAYAAEDADVTLQIHGALLPRVERDAKLKRIYADIEIPVSSVLLAMERNGVLIDMQLLTRQGQELGQKMLDLEQEGPRARRRPLQPGLAQAAGRDPLRPPEAQGGEEDAVGRALHRRGGAGEARRGPSALPHAARPPQRLEAEEHLHRQAAADGASEDRPRAHQLRAGGRGHRAALVQRSEPAEHPGAHRRGPAHPRGVHRAAGLEDRLGRLLADRAAHHGAPLGRQGPGGRVRARRGRAPPHRRRGVRHAAATRSRASSAATPR